MEAQICMLPHVAFSKHVMRSAVKVSRLPCSAKRWIRTLHMRILMPGAYGQVVNWKNCMRHHSSQKRTMQESMHANGHQVKCSTCSRMHVKTGRGVGLGAATREIWGHGGAWWGNVDAMLGHLEQHQRWQANRRIRTLHMRILMPAAFGQVVNWMKYASPFLPEAHNARINARKGPSS